MTSKAEQKGWVSPATLEVATVWPAGMQGCVGKWAENASGEEGAGSAAASPQSASPGLPFRGRSWGLLQLEPTTKSHAHWWQVSLTLAKVTLLLRHV